MSVAINHLPSFAILALWMYACVCVCRFRSFSLVHLLFWSVCPRDWCEKAWKQIWLSFPLRINTYSIAYAFAYFLWLFFCLDSLLWWTYGVRKERRRCCCCSCFFQFPSKKHHLELITAVGVWTLNCIVRSIPIMIFISFYCHFSFDKI